MKMLMIVAGDSMMSELEKLLHNVGITAYSMINKIMGAGRAGKVKESFFDVGYTGGNLMILAVLQPDQVDQAVRALKAFREARVQGAQGKPVPFKLFAIPCEELI